MVMPNFFIIGAIRAGTTSIYHYLKQHPEVYMSPIKDTDFFVHEGKNIDDYRALFQGFSGEKAIGDVSSRYLYSPQAAERIKYYTPEAKLIAILRNPVERAYSHYYMHVRERRERRTFIEAIDDEKKQVRNNNLSFGQRRYVNLGFYHRHLLPYFDLFDRRQIAIYLFEELKADAKGLMRNIFQFLDVADEFVPDVSIQYHVSGIPKTKILRPLLWKSPVITALGWHLPSWLHHTALAFREILRSRQLVKPPLSPEIRSSLVFEYREDILLLQELIQKDLSKWLK
jgi:hypothetical protein